MQSEQINELATALCKAQSEIEGAVTDSDNPFHKSKYADLHTCWKSCRDQLTKNGLSVAQTMDYQDDKTILVTTMFHISGQWIQGKMPLPLHNGKSRMDKDGKPLPPVMPTAQEVGSAITYCRRYALSAIVGLSQYDDDGEEVMKAERAPRPKQEIKPESDKKQLHKKICATGNLVTVEDLDKFLAFMSEKYSKPDQPYTEEECIKHALESIEKLGIFMSKMAAWLKPT